MGVSGERVLKGKPVRERERAASKPLACRTPRPMPHDVQAFT